nr:cold shock domain-containing protein [Paenibacillus larvae]
MQTGTVKWFNAEKGLWLYRNRTGKRCIRSFSSIEGDGYKSLDEGQRVQFNVTQGNRGPQA